MWKVPTLMPLAWCSLSRRWAPLVPRIRDAEGGSSSSVSKHQAHANDCHSFPKFNRLLKILVAGGSFTDQIRHPIVSIRCCGFPHECQEWSWEASMHPQFHCNSRRWMNPKAQVRYRAPDCLNACKLMHASLASNAVILVFFSKRRRPLPQI